MLLKIHMKVKNIVCVTIKIFAMKLHQTNESVQEFRLIHYLLECIEASTRLLTEVDHGTYGKESIVMCFYV